MNPILTTFRLAARGLGRSWLWALSWLLLAVVFSGLGACRGSPGGNRTSSSSAEPESPGPPPSPKPAPSAPQLEPVTLTIVYGSEKKTWLEEQAKNFEAKNPKVRSSRPIRIDARAMGSGEGLEAIVSGQIKAAVYSPASSAYIALVNRAWLSQAGHTQPIATGAEPVVLSPLVIATWKPMAEALGFPKKQLGWKDFIAVSKNPRGWEAHGHPEWGPFKLGHTHPELSNSGLLSIVAEAYAGAKKTRGLGVADLSRKATRDFVSGVEKTIVHYGKSTGFFADKMLERGPAYLSAAVLYENLVIESYSKKTDSPFPLVAIYPVEGTFWSDHPFAILDAPWVGPDEREAALQFLSFLKERPQQERALALGFRPADPAIAMAAPIDAEHGVDPKQPQTLLELPDGATLDALLALWRENKKPADVALVFDKSGSMTGKPLAEAKAGAKAFLDALGDRDQVTLLLFDSRIYPPIGPLTLAGNRESISQRIDGIIAGGGTALYDATSSAYAMLMQRAGADPGTIHAVVVMTDGKDEHSQLTLEQLDRSLGVEGGGAPVKVFTIAYGPEAQTDVLGRIAEAAQGTTAKGNVENIVQVYRDMASFF